MRAPYRDTQEPTGTHRVAGGRGTESVPISHFKTGQFLCLLRPSRPFTEALATLAGAAPFLALSLRLCHEQDLIVPVLVFVHFFLRRTGALLKMLLLLAQL